LNTFDCLTPPLQGNHRLFASTQGHPLQANSWMIGEITNIVTFSAVGLDKNASQRGWLW